MDPMEKIVENEIRFVNFWECHQRDENDKIRHFCTFKDLW